MVFGAFTGFAGSLLVFFGLGVAGAVDASRGSAALVFLQYLAQLIAGYIGGRLAGSARILNGSIAAALFFLIAAGVSVAGGSGPGPVVLATFAAVALVIGGAGGALAEWQADRVRNRDDHA